jgi:hypothetical protein
MDNPANFDRRLLLHAAAGLILTTAGARAMNDTDYTSAGKPGKITGKGVGDFDFLAGEWKIAHRRLKDGTTDVWEESVSGATVHRVLDGMGSIEELRAPSGKFMGMGIRVWLPQDKKWADHWTGAHNGVVNPPQKGEFIDGEGVFISDEEVDGVKWLYRGVWDKITPTSCRWHQSSSKDGGKTWEWNWWMDWTRVSEPVLP